MAKLPEPIASFRTTITNKITSSAATILIDSVTDDDGVSMDGKILGFVIDKGKAEEEYILGTVDYANSQLVSVTRGLSVSDGATSIAGNKSAHRKKASIEVSDHPYITLLARLMNGTDGIDPSYRPKLSSDVNTTDDKQFVTTAQLNRTAMGGVTSSRVLCEGTAGETLAAGNLVYLKSADGRWWKADADTAATVDNVILSIAQGTGTAGNAVTGGLLLWGIDSNQSVRTIGAIQYASNTAGGISESVGTVEVTIGQAKSATEIYFYPRLNQQITEDQQDALAGSSGTPSATNKYVTAGDENRNTGVVHYGASTAGSDAYAITPSPAITAYAAGQMFAVKADVANTGACTLQVSGLASPKSIKTTAGSDPGDGYIPAGGIFVVRYDGTNMVLMSPSAAKTGYVSGVLSDYSSAVNNTTDTTVTTTFTPRWIKIHYSLQGYRTAGYTAVRGVAVYNGTTLKFNDITGGSLVTGSVVTDNQMPTLDATASIPNSTAAITVGNITDGDGRRITLTINSVSATTIVIRLVTEINGGVTTARARIAYEAFE